jgi:hypothetical protein
VVVLIATSNFTLAHTGVDANELFRKFYGEQEDLQPITHDNRLCNEALMHGDEINASQYTAGKPKK